MLDFSDRTRTGISKLISRYAQLLLVNLGMIWCFGFFFLELLDDCDEESQQRREALASLNDVGRKLGSVPTRPR